MATALTLKLGESPDPRIHGREHFVMRKETANGKWHIAPAVGSFRYWPVCNTGVNPDWERPVTADTNTCARCAKAVPQGWFNS